jgi:uncharacterized membrane protein
MVDLEGYLILPVAVATVAETTADTGIITVAIAAIAAVSAVANYHQNLCFKEQDQQHSVYQILGNRQWLVLTEDQNSSRDSPVEE